MAAAVVNTNIATAVGVLTWMALDGLFSKAKKPTFMGGINGMICGLVGITPCAGWVNGWGAIMVGAFCTIIVWVAWNYLSKVRPFSKVDDTLGVIYTHGIAGFFGGLFVGVFGDPNMVEYGCGTLNKFGQVVNTSNAQYLATSKTCTPFSVSGLMYTGSFHQLWEQFRAAVFVIIWSALITFILIKLIGYLLHGAAYKDSILEVGDLAIHDEVVTPEFDKMWEEAGLATIGMGVGSLVPPSSYEAEPPPSSGG
jgi:Amt family ammonium transporter